MASFTITNCHTHTFTSKHVPKYYPSKILWIFKRVPGLVRLLAWTLRILGQQGYAETLDRLYRFQAEVARTKQSEIFETLRMQYPHGTRFVVLPMDMAQIGHGPVQADIRAQHDELAGMAADDRYLGTVIPFASVHPGSPGAAEEVRRCIEDLHFRGLKIYPRLGFAPDDDLLMDQVYPILLEHDRPLMTHCSRGGVQGKNVPTYLADRYTDPAAYKPVMTRHEGLRICLAHFGGARDWRDYVENGMPPGDADARKKNWQVATRDMISSGDWPDLWTDISYTLFHFDDNVPFLRLFLHGEDAGADRLRRRVLFGSDYYMTRQETLSERAVCFRLRNALGEEVFRQISETNPAIWLGEAADPHRGK